MNTVQEEKPITETVTSPRHPGDIRNAELVSRLLAATPPYLYGAMPLQPHAFFFSEMLRSFVQARHTARASQHIRRNKKRPINHLKYFANDESTKAEWRKRHEESWTEKTLPALEKIEDEREKVDVPLELTVDKISRPNSRSSPKLDIESDKRSSSVLDVGSEAIQPNLILPPPPPIWYPPMFNPQYDPLNFLIDFRVSGNMFDRKRLLENRDVPRFKHNSSAFSVPQRHLLNDRDFLRRDIGGTSYVMKNLKQIYENLRTNVDEDKKTVTSNEVQEID